MRTFKIFLIVGILIGIIPDAEACTSAIVSAKASRDGRPMLWKHRDTSAIDNVVEYIAPEDGSFGYVALFNAEDKNREQAWMGMNDVGFAIMNTASYNLKDDDVDASKMDREGYVMTIALRKCRTVDDFANLLATLPRPMGVEANFGVIDASGNGAFFETNNHAFERFNLSDAPDGVLLRTNYSKSGRDNEGFGFNRYCNAEHLLAPYIKEKNLYPELFTEDVSRSFYHDLLKRDYAAFGDRWVVDQDFIPRFKSTATIVIEGVAPVADVEKIKPGELADEYIMWTGIGYPPCSEIVAVRCKADGVPEGLRASQPDGTCALGNEAKARRAEVFPLTAGNGSSYIDMSKLFNAEGTGYVQQLRPKNLATYKRERERRDGRQ